MKCPECDKELPKLLLVAVEHLDVEFGICPHCGCHIKKKVLESDNNE